MLIRLGVLYSQVFNYRFKPRSKLCVVVTLTWFTRFSCADAFSKPLWITKSRRLHLLIRRLFGYWITTLTRLSMLSALAGLKVAIHIRLSGLMR
jgi:hypothetical protein